MRVIPGEIRVEEAEQVLDQEHAKVWHVELASKYAEVLAYSDDEVLLMASERTLNVSEKHRGQATRLVTDLPACEGWYLIVTCARYTCRICAYRIPEPAGDIERPDPAQPATEPGH